MQDIAIIVYTYSVDYVYSEVPACEEYCGSREYCNRFCTSCTSDTNCASNERCNNGYCEEVSCLHECGATQQSCDDINCRFISCTSSSQCEAGEKCGNGYCFPLLFYYTNDRCTRPCGYRTKGWDCASVCPACRYGAYLTPDTEFYHI